MGKTKVNPRRKPVNQADISKAKMAATTNAIRASWVIMFTCLGDKWGWGKKRLKRLWDDVEQLSDSVIKGYVSIDDLTRALKEEKGVEVS